MECFKDVVAGNGGEVVGGGSGWEEGELGHDAFGHLFGALSLDEKEFLKG